MTLPNNSFEVGDRVYNVAKPLLTGTISEKNPTYPDMVRVKWDNPGLVRPSPCPFSWYADKELECYTRPAGDPLDAFVEGMIAYAE